MTIPTDAELSQAYQQGYDDHARWVRDNHNTSEEMTMNDNKTTRLIIAADNCISCGADGDDAPQILKDLRAQYDRDRETIRELAAVLSQIANARADRVGCQHDMLWEWMRDKARAALARLDGGE